MVIHRIPKIALILILLTSCSEEQEMYPSITTDIADIRTDYLGTMTEMITDDGRHLIITNTDIQPHRPDTTYRAVVGYTMEEQTEAGGRILIHSLEGARVLADSTSLVRHDATGIESMWAQGAYINMQLTALIQEGRHTWGFAVDSVWLAEETGHMHTHHHLSIHHNQGQDPLYFSQTYYRSIKKTDIAGFCPGDTVSVAVHTFKGVMKWTFPQHHQ